MFIIYSSFSTAVTQRRKEIGILRALGATRRQIAILFLGESAIGGVVGSTVGVLVGYVAAGVMARVIGNILQGIYGVVQADVSITPGVGLIVITMAIGIVTSMVAAGIPARNAAGTDPIQALSKGKVQALSSGESRVRIVAAAVSATIGGVVFVGTQSLAWFYSGYAFVILAAVLLTPILSRGLAKALRLILQWLRPVEGALAADSLIGSARRTSATVGALMLSLALVVGLAGTARSTYSSIMHWVGAALNSDFFVASSPTLTGNNYRFPDSMGPQLASIAGIQTSTPCGRPGSSITGTAFC